MSTVIGYYVHFSTRVDHPERRNASFRVRTVHTVSDKWFVRSFAEAVSLYEGLLRGESDCESEYTRQAYVMSATDDGGNARLVRRSVRRYRSAAGLMFDDTTADRADAMRAAEFADLDVARAVRAA